MSTRSTCSLWLSRLAFTTVAGTILAAAGLSTTPRAIAKTDGGSDAAPGFAVVELFTSEGCSSCPPADDLVAELTKAESTTGRQVYFLAMHVDYWDYLGWKDRFASPEFTARQREYSEQFKTDSIYTPQMVVNGQAEFVGSSRRKAHDAIEGALEKPANAKVTAEIEPREAGKPIAINVRGSDWPAGATVNVALVESGLSSDVTRGENSGHVLKHERVVRTFARREANADGVRLSITPPAGVNEANAEVVVFIQRGMGEIVGATKVSLAK